MCPVYLIGDSTSDVTTSLELLVLAVQENKKKTSSSFEFSPRTSVRIKDVNGSWASDFLQAERAKKFTASPL